MSLQWGIGIEHELLSYLQGETVTGASVLDNLRPDLYGISKYIQRFINPTSHYPTYQLYDINRFTLTSDLKSAVIPKNLVDLLETYCTLYLGSPDKGHTTQTLIDRFLSILDKDGINAGSVVEFKSRLWANQSITNAVEQVKLEQHLILSLVNLTRETATRPVHYAKYGSIFPLTTAESEKYWLDYTGSYHLNVSLPYPKDKLTTEQHQYSLVENRILHEFKTEFNLLQSTYPDVSDLYRLLQKRCVFTMLIGKIPEATSLMDEGTLKYFQDTYTTNMTPYLNQYISTIIHTKQANITDFIFQMAIRKRHTRMICYYYNSNDKVYIPLISLETKRIYTASDIFYPLYDKFNEILTSNQLDTSRSNAPTYLFYVTRNQIRVVNTKLSLFWFVVDPRNRLNDKQVDIIHQLTRPNPPREVITTSHAQSLEPIVSYLVSKLLPTIQTKFISIITNIFTEINTRRNLQEKYNPPGFHHLHKQWAIGIQWVLPLLLSCYSSADPFSIGDNNKLSELSLRLFISGFNFINLSDIMRYNLSDDRELLPWQGNSRLIRNCQHQFMYHWETPEVGEFRVDARHGFHFGFELRVFDNFDIIHLEPLLEFLFLLADLTAHPDIRYTKNPFTSKILNGAILQILKQGWNTSITTEYRKLLNEQLKLKLPVTGSMTSYSVTNHIYHQLQIQFLDLGSGRGRGPYTQYLINRRAGLRDLPNINRQSWENHFTNLIWNPTPQTPTRKIIEQAIYQATDQQQLIKSLRSKLPSGYRDDISDIVYALKSLGISFQ
jgi:hypothetical protein